MEARGSEAGRSRPEQTTEGVGMHRRPVRTRLLSAARRCWTPNHEEKQLQMARCSSTSYPQTSLASGGNENTFSSSPLSPSPPSYRWETCLGAVGMSSAAAGRCGKRQASQTRYTPTKRQKTPHMASTRPAAPSLA